MIKVYKIVEQEISEKEYLVFAKSKAQADDFLANGDALHTHIQGNYDRKWTVSKPFSNQELEEYESTFWGSNIPIVFAMYHEDIDALPMAYRDQITIDDKNKRAHLKPKSSNQLRKENFHSYINFIRLMGVREND
tara:strand:- start:357 stop:761 length:405 start_codon:yes stop_codon:yes gene_type:complete